MTQVLSLSLRPKKFSQMVGVTSLVGKLRGHFDTIQRIPPSLMFVGRTGSGKTTIARIIAISLQCEHQEQFGEPCIECRRKRKEFDITELNVADCGTQDIRDIMKVAQFSPRYGSKRKVFILDEAQTMHPAAQNYCLKLLEDWPETSIWIWCLTQPEKLLPTLRSRCLVYKMPSFGLEETRSLVAKAIKAADGKRSADDLAEELMLQGVTGPRSILMAVEKYLADTRCSAKEAAIVEVSNIDTYRICRGLVNGAWRDVAKELIKCSYDDAPAIKSSVLGYLNAILLRDGIASERNRELATWIVELSKLDPYQFAGLSGYLYMMTRYFRTSKRG